MIVRFIPRPEDLQRLQVGPLGPHLPSFATLVSQQGYCSVTGWLKGRLVAKLSRWLQQHRVPLSEFNERHIAAFFNDFEEPPDYSALSNATENTHYAELGIMGIRSNT